MKQTYESALELLKEGKVNEAMPILEAVVQEDPKNVQSIYALGVGYFKANQKDKAQETFQKVISLDGQNSKAYYYLGFISEEQKRLEEAKEFYGSALEINPNFMEAKLRLASLYNLSSASMDAIRASQTSKPISSSGGGGTLSDVLKQGSTADKFEIEKNVAGRLIYEGNRRKSSFRKSMIFLIFAIPLGIFPFAHWELVPYPHKYLFDDYYLNGQAMVAGIALLLLSLFVIGYVFLAARSNKYSIFEYRIDFKSGILRRNQFSLWQYEIADVSMQRSPLDLLTNNASIYLKTQQQQIPGGSHYVISGLVNASFMENLWKELRDASLVERRAMKNWWV